MFPQITQYFRHLYFVSLVLKLIDGVIVNVIRVIQKVLLFFILTGIYPARMPLQHINTRILKRFYFNVYITLHSIF